LAAGADMVGKTHSDELAYSLNGENVHYGTPINPRAPDRIPGGSSSGSAAAVAGGLVDFALGTDCGGSIRLPASYCGIDPAEVERMRPRREEVARRIADLIGDDAVLCLPAAPGIAPKLKTPPAELEAFRARAFALLCVAGLARLPQFSLPFAALDGCPLGLSLIAPRAHDLGLLAWVEDKLR
jgi:Asp-tRNA(Asn)/Glu-tRNA(Gln) amidotransferase A subunit family amidase